MSKQLIECVPNISEGRDQSVIDQVASMAETVDGIKLLDVDPGKATTARSARRRITDARACMSANCRYADLTPSASECVLLTQLGHSAHLWFSHSLIIEWGKVLRA